jgi:ABC-2 type transport system ATP-binding protein
MIEVAGLRRTFGPSVALDGVTFGAPRGEVTGLLGPNGAGKTTCLRILAGFLPPSAGRVCVDGIDVATRSLEVRRRLGYLPEGAPAYPEMRVRDCLRFRAALKGARGREGRAEVDRVVEACGLAEAVSRLVGQLSRGYRQRLGLADALLGDPAVLVLDEPTSGLDPNQSREVRSLVRSLAGRRTVLFSSHSLPEVEAVCSRAVILARGRVVADGAIEELGRLEGARVLVGVRAPAAAAVSLLGGLEGVRRVVPLSAEGEEVARLLLEGDTGPELRERVAAAAGAAGWPLQELRTEAAGIEALFARITGATEADRPGGEPDDPGDREGA